MAKLLAPPPSPGRKPECFLGLQSKAALQGNPCTQGYVWVEWNRSVSEGKKVPHMPTRGRPGLLVLVMISLALGSDVIYFSFHGFQGALLLPHPMLDMGRCSRAPWKDRARS